MESELSRDVLSVNQQNVTIQEIRRETATQIISQICKVQILPLNGSSAVDEICSRYGLHPIQHFFHSHVLDAVRQSVEREYIYEATDALDVHLLFFSVSGIPYLLGPFACSHLTERDAANLLRKEDIRDLDVSSFWYYRGTLPIFATVEAIQIATAFIYNVNPDEPGKTIRRITDMGMLPDEDEKAQGARPNYNVKLEHRYAMEQQFIEDIKNGNTRSALHTMSFIKQDVAYLKRTGPPLETERVGTAITRTTIRHAALQVGLPPLIVDKLSTENNLRCRKATAVEEIHLAEEIMIRDFCKAIREIRENKYSALVQSVLYCLNHEYSGNVNLTELAEELDISETRLTKTFKKELGVTPAAYLTKVRMKNAAALLISGTMAVSAVSSAVGISDSNYFVKLFKKEFGETPSAYRKRHTT